MSVSSETLRSISAPERLETRLGTLEFVDCVPSGETFETVFEHLDSVHGRNACLEGLVGVSTHAIRKGFTECGAIEE